MAIGSGNSEAGVRPAWLRWLMPSVSDLIFVSMMGMLVFTALSVRLLGDAGIGWHIRTGQEILATHSIPHQDPFSSSMAGRPWFAWEWLYDVLAGWLESAAGLNGVAVFTGVAIAGVFAWTFRLLILRGTNVIVALILLLLGASASSIHFLARPHVVSWLFAVFWFWVLESTEKVAGSEARRSWLLWTLPLVMLIWVNVHGSFLLGFVLLGIYWAAAMGRWIGGSRQLTEDSFDQTLRGIRAGRRVWNFSLAGVLAAAASLANPYGLQLHLHVYRYLTNHFLIDHIDEFRSPNFHYLAQDCFAILLLLTMAALAVRRSRTSAREFLLIAFAVYSGLYASRNLPVSSLLLILVIGPWLSEAAENFTGGRPIREAERGSPAFVSRMKTIELSLRGHVWPIAAVVLACWSAAHGGMLGQTRIMDAHFDAKKFPVAAVDDLEKDGAEKLRLRGPLLSPDSWGGYLIYRLYPGSKVVIDDRHDFYGEEFLKSYLKLVHAEPGWEDFLREHPTQLVFAPKDSALANILSITAGWRAVYRDEVAVVFERASANR